jgi:glucosyl-dolichyl phosphate glucuronosyltransferase
MKISIILCTYNRCRSLARALDSIAASTFSTAVEWEVLVMDNNSSDQTREVAEDFRCQYPERFRYLFVSQQGKSHALNAGIREARGDVLAFTDDDVTVEPTWLHNLKTALDSGEWAGSAGRTLPERTFSPPRWLSLEGRHALGPLALFDLGPVAGELTEPPFGNNMAYRKEMFEKYGGFRTDLGPRPGSEIRSEDTEFGRLLLAAGERLRYEPSAVVYHAVPENRLQKTYFLTWWFDKARGDIRAFGIPPGTKWFVVGIPLYMFRRLAVWMLRWIFSVKPSGRFSCKLNVWITLGSIVESCRLTQEAKRQEMPINADFSAPQGFYGPASYDGAVIEKNRFDHLADSEANSRKLP